MWVSLLSIFLVAGEFILVIVGVGVVVVAIAAVVWPMNECCCESTCF